MKLNFNKRTFWIPKKTFQLKVSSRLLNGFITKRRLIMTSHQRMVSFYHFFYAIKGCFLRLLTDKKLLYRCFVERSLHNLDTDRKFLTLLSFKKLLVFQFRKCGWIPTNAPLYMQVHNNVFICKFVENFSSSSHFRHALIGCNGVK